MSYITFSSKFKFLVRFKLLDNYQYEDKDYNLFGDGPCGDSEPRYSVTVNPVTQSIAGSFILKNINILNPTIYVVQHKVQQKNLYIPSHNVMFCENIADISRVNSN
jgi:hypothetical protein